MAPIITFHAPHSGAGKSELTANLAYLLAAQGNHVAIVDLSNLSRLPHWFGFQPILLNQQWNNVLWHPSSWQNALTNPWVPVQDGAIAILTLGDNEVNPVSGFTLARELQQDNRQDQLSQNLASLLAHLKADFLFIETTPGFNEEALLALAISDLVGIVLRLESEDFQNTAVMTDLADRLQVPQTCLVASAVPPGLPFEDVVVQLTEAYNLPILGLLPPLEEPPLFSKSPLLCRHHPAHAYSKGVEAIAQQMMTFLRI